MKIELDVQNATEFTPLPSKEQLENWVGLALQGREATELTIRLVDREESRTLNAQYRDKDTATNVLSFVAEVPDEVELPLLGDIVICAPLVAAEAEQQGKLPEHHWAHLVVHGVLHLLGYDHQEKHQAEEMEALETGLLAQLGISNPYA